MGGVVSSFQTPFMQNKRHESVIESVLSTKVVNQFLGNSFVSELKSMILPRCCGSSGAVLSLMGFNEVLRAKCLFDLFSKLRSPFNQPLATSSECVDLVGGFIGSAVYIMHEWKLMRCDAIDPSRLINHAAHIQGFTFGAVFGMLYIIRINIIKRNSVLCRHNDTRSGKGRKLGNL